MTAEQFLRDKLASEITTFGDGTTEFHTRDIEHLLICLDEKDIQIRELEQKSIDLSARINLNVERKFKELLELCMNRDNMSSEERLGYIRATYKETWDSVAWRKTISAYEESANKAQENNL